MDERRLTDIENDAMDFEIDRKDVLELVAAVRALRKRNDKLEAVAGVAQFLRGRFPSLDTALSELDKEDA